MLRELFFLLILINFLFYDIEDYIPDESDCSNMAALIHDYLELHGFNAKIVYTYNDKVGHTYVYVPNLDVCVEPYFKSVVNCQNCIQLNKTRYYDDYRLMPFEKSEWEYKYKEESCSCHILARRCKA